MSKISSYQKLKNQLYEAQLKNRKLIQAIAIDDFTTLSEVKTLYLIEAEAERALWFGDSNFKNPIDELRQYPLRPNECFKPNTEKSE